MQLAFETLIRRVADAEDGDAVVEVFKRASRSKPAELLAYLLQEIYSTKGGVYYFKACAVLEPQVMTRDFSVLTLFKLAELLKQDQRADVLQIYERAVLSLPRFPGTFVFFTNGLGTSFALQEARLYFKKSFPPPGFIKTSFELKYAAAAATFSDIDYIFGQAMRMLETTADIDDFCICLIVAGELLRKRAAGVSVRSIREEALTEFLVQFRPQLTNILVEAKAAVETSTLLLTRVIAIRFYFEIVHYVTPAVFSSVHTFFQQATYRLMEQFAGNRQEIVKTIETEAEALQASPIICKFICGTRCLMPIARGFENDILGAAASIVNWSAVNSIGAISGFTVAIMNAQIALNKNSDNGAFCITQQQSRAVVTAMLELMLQPMEDSFTLKVAERVCFIAFYNPDLVVDTLKTAFYNAKLQVESLNVFYELLEVIEGIGFTTEYEKILEFIVQCINHVLYEELKLQKDPNHKLCEFIQRNVQYFETNKEYKQRIEEPLLKLICKIVRTNYQHKLNISLEIINDYLELFVDSFCGTFSMDSPQHADDQLVLKLTETLPELREQLVKIVIDTIFFREFKYSEEQEMEVYGLELKLYYGCFVLLNLIIHEEVDHFVLIKSMVGFGLEFIDVVALATMLLLCVGIEKAECKFSIIGLREQVLSVLNYLVQIQLEEEHYAVLECFFGAEINECGKFKSALNDYSDENKFLVEIIINTSRLFITKMLQLFDFSKQNFGIHIVFNEFFPGYKWRSYNPLIELSVNTSENRTKEQLESTSCTEQSQSATVSTAIEESEIDTYKQLIESSAFHERLANKADDYVFEIFQFVYELLSLLQPQQAYRFYLRCYQTQLIQCTGTLIEREFQYRLSILGLVRRLEGISFDYEELIHADAKMSDFKSVLADEFMDVLMNCTNLQNKQLKITDLAYLVDAVAAASLEMILVLLLRLQNSQELPQALCLEIFQLSIRNPCMMDVLSDVRIRQTMHDSGLLKAQCAQTLELLNILILKFQQFEKLKIYKQLCYSCFHLLGLAQVLVECKQLDERKAEIYIVDIINYLLSNSSFGAVDLEGCELDINFSEESRAILQKDGFSHLLQYFQKNDQIEHFAVFSVNERYAHILAENGLHDLGLTEFDLEGPMAQCVHLWNQTISQFSSIIANFRLSTEVKTVMLLKSLSILRIVHENPEIRPIYSSQIQPRLLQFIIAALEAEFTGETYERVVAMFISLFAQCRNIEQMKFVKQALLEVEAVCIGLFDIPKQTARYLVCDNRSFGAIGADSTELCQLINYGQYSAATYYMQQSIRAQGKELLETASEDEFEQFLNYLMHWPRDDDQTVSLVIRLMHQEQRYYNTVLPTINKIISRSTNMLAKCRAHAYILMAHAVFLYQNVEQPRRKDFVGAFIDLFKLHPDIFCGLVVHYATQNIYLLSQMVADIMNNEGMDSFLRQLFELLRECFVHSVFCLDQKMCYAFNILAVYINFLQALIINGQYKNLLLKTISEGQKVLFALLVILERIFLFPKQNAELRSNQSFVRAVIEIFFTLVRFGQGSSIQDITDIIEEMQNVQAAESIEPEMALSQETDLFLRLSNSLFSRGTLSISYAESSVVFAYSLNLKEDNLDILHLSYCIAAAGSASCTKNVQAYAKLLEFVTYQQHTLYSIFCRFVLTFLASHQDVPLDVINAEEIKIIDLVFERNFDLDAFLLKQLKSNVTRALIAATTHVEQLKDISTFCRFAVQLTGNGSRETLLQAIELLSEAANSKRDLVRAEVMENIFEIMKRCDGHSQLIFQQLVCRMRGEKDFHEAIVFLLLEKYGADYVVEQLSQKGGSICFRMQILLQMCIERKIPQSIALGALCEAINSGFFAEDEQKSAMQILGQLIELEE